MQFLIMSTAGQTCVYTSCKNTKKNNKSVSFFRFPIKDPLRLELWKINSGNSSILLMEVDALANKLICENHFSPADIQFSSRRKILITTAVPVKYSVEAVEGKLFLKITLGT